MRSFNCDMYWPLLTMYWENSGFGMGVLYKRGLVIRGRDYVCTIYIHTQTCKDTCVYIYMYMYIYACYICIGKANRKMCKELCWLLYSWLAAYLGTAVSPPDGRANPKIFNICGKRKCTCPQLHGSQVFAQLPERVQVPC